MAITVDKLGEQTKNETMVVKIISLREKETKTEKGEGVYHYGMLGDGSGTLPFTAWSIPATIRAGDVVELKNFTVKKYNDALRVYIDSKTEVVLRPDDKLDVKHVYKEYKIKELNLKDAFVSVTGILKDPIEKTYEKDGQAKTVVHSTFEDDTGSIRISLFDRKLAPGRYYKIDGAKLSEYKGRYRLTAGDKTQIAEVGSFSIPDIKIYDINELARPVDSINITGTVVFLGDKGGLISRCSECRKTIDDIRCPDHPEAKIFLDLYAYFTIEDGTGDIQCNVGRAGMLELLNLKEEDLNIEKPKVSKADVSKRLAEKILSVPILLDGDAVMGTNGISFRARRIRRMDEPLLKKVMEAYEGEML
ncbi:MAG: hypothetical protein M1327_05210 [Candidatus Thermoplasmatota archaeon]|nr:hypothetical protein [Candidatus Thermoplasmatota archaeon]